MKRFVWLLVLLVACAQSLERDVITVYKTPTCGCCGGYVTYLQDNGFKVNVIQLNDLDSIKKKYNIPDDMLSCHTSVMNDYFIEGHVPVEVIHKLMQEKPAIDGIALPGMPAGTPGMGGSKNEPWTIFGLKDGTTSEFMMV